MKNIIMPKEKTNMVRRYGRASACTSGAAFTRSRRLGANTYPRGAMRPMERVAAVMNAWYTVRFTFSWSPCPVKRATSTPIPVNTEEMKTMTTRKICQETPMAAFPVKPT